MRSVTDLLWRLVSKKQRTALADCTLWTREYPELASFEIGAWTYGRPKVVVSPNGAMLRIGKFCSIASGVTILLGGEHRADWVTTYPFNVLFAEAARIPGHPSTKGDVVIGNDVWVGRNVTILSGVTVGNGAVIGACSLVTKSVEPYTIVGGNPAKPIRRRFSDPVIEDLQRLAWWDWPHDLILDAVPELLDSKVELFLAKYGKLRSMQ